MSRDLVGKVVGGYRLGEILNKGDAGTVYSAEHSSTGRQVVGKVFAADFSRDKNAAARLVAEVQKATGVKHPHLVEVLDVGTVESKGKRHLYIVMERLKGETLSARLSGQPGRPLPLHQALQIASDIGAALQALHRQGITHGGINAGAVFLSPPDDLDVEDTVHLLGLGSRPVRVAEQQNKPATVQDDLRALAILVQEMLGGGAPRATGAEQVILPLRQANREVPVHVDAALRCALGEPGSPRGPAGATGTGFASATAFVAALLGSGETMPAIGVWSSDGTPPPVAGRGGFSMAWVVALLAVIGSGIGLWLHYREPAGPGPAVADLSSPAPRADLAPVAGDLAAQVDLSGRPDLGAAPDLARPARPDLGAPVIPGEKVKPRPRPVRKGPKIPPFRGPLDYNPSLKLPPSQPEKTPEKPSDQATDQEPKKAPVKAIENAPAGTPPPSEASKAPAKPKRPRRTGPPIPPYRLRI